MYELLQDVLGLRLVLVDPLGVLDDVVLAGGLEVAELALIVLDVLVYGLEM